MFFRTTTGPQKIEVNEDATVAITGTVSGISASEVGAVPASGGTFSGSVSFGDNDITNVGNIAVDTISSDSGTSIGVTLGNNPGDDFNVDSGKLVVEGDTGNVGVGKTPNTGRNLDVLDKAQITGQEGTSASLYLVADEGDDNGDAWRINSNQDVNDLTISNNVTGSFVDAVTIATDGGVTFNGGIDDAGTITAGTIGSGVTGFGLITGVDTWRLTADKTTSGNLTSDLERVSSDNSEYGSIGTAMTESSGIFTFPSTGIWMVQAFHSGRSDNGAVLYMGIIIDYASDGINFNDRARTINGSSQTSYWNQGST